MNLSGGRMYSLKGLGRNRGGEEAVPFFIITLILLLNYFQLYIFIVEDNTIIIFKSELKIYLI
jgi:hypothetical protein